MLTDTEIKINGYQVLVKALGEVLAEKFISLMIREPFDYTKWQKGLLVDRTVEELSNSAMKNIKNSG